jgi:hypothetical protein
MPAERNEMKVDGFTNTAVSEDTCFDEIRIECEARYQAEQEEDWTQMALSEDRIEWLKRSILKLGGYTSECLEKYEAEQIKRCRDNWEFIRRMMNLR